MEQSRLETMDMETFSRTLESTLECIDEAESSALELARRAGFMDPALEGIGLAVREIVTNAVVHGNRNDRRKKVFLTISLTSERLEITIADQGDGFDVNRVPDPVAPDTLLRGSGRGIFLARALMDEVHVRRGDLGGTVIAMVAYVQGRVTH